MKLTIITVIVTTMGALPFHYGHADEVNLKCEPPVEAPVSSTGKLYTFSTRITCTLQNANLTIPQAQELTRQMLSTSPDFVIYNAQENIIFQEMPGVELDLLEKLTNGHGKIDIRYKALLVSDQTKLIFNTDSTEILASGKNGYTKKARYSVELTETDSGMFILMAIKTVDVLRPAIAPASIFISKAQEGITEDTRYVLNKFYKVFK